MRRWPAITAWCRALEVSQRYNLSEPMVLALSRLGALPGVAQDASQSAPPPASSGEWHQTIPQINAQRDPRLHLSLRTGHAAQRRTGDGARCWSTTKITAPQRLAWLQVRDNTCRVGGDPLGCRIRLTRE